MNHDRSMGNKIDKPQGLWLGVMEALRRWETWATLAVLALVVGLFVERGPILALVVRRRAVWDWIRSFGYLAPLAYIALFAAQILVAPVPGHFMGLMGGYLFGALWGSVYSLIGLALGASLSANVARRLGRPVLRRLVGQEQLGYWERRWRIRSPVTWWLILLFPVPDAAYYLAGLSGVPLHWLLLAVLAGRGPGLVMGNWLGHRAATLPPQFSLLAVALSVGVMFVIYRHQRRLRLIMLLARRRLRRWWRRFKPRSRRTMKRKAREEGVGSG